MGRKGTNYFITLNEFGYTIRFQKHYRIGKLRNLACSFGFPTIYDWTII